MAIALRIGWISEIVDVVEIQLGNLHQGLVAALLAGEEPWAHTRYISTYSFDDWTIQGVIEGGQIYDTGPGETRGFIKDGLLGWRLTPLTDFSPRIGVDACVQIDNVQWFMPLARDDDLLNRLSYYPCQATPSVGLAGHSHLDAHRSGVCRLCGFLARVGEEAQQCLDRPG